MVSRRQFLFGAAAGSVALSFPQGLTGKIVSALLSPSATPSTPTVLTAAIAKGGFDAKALFYHVDYFLRRSGQSFDFIARGDKDDIMMWERNRQAMLRNMFLDLKTFMQAAVTKDLESTQLETRAIIMKNFHSSRRLLDATDKFASHEIVLDQISKTLDQMTQELARLEKIAPQGTKFRPASLNDIHMIMLPNFGVALQIGNKPSGGHLLKDDSDTHSTYTIDYLKFLTELEFLRINGYQARILTLPEQEQSILDTFEANPANWSHLVKCQRALHDGDKTIACLNAAFPKREEMRLIYEAAHQKEKNRKDLPWGGTLPQICIPWDVVVQMNNQPDAFVPIMHEGIERDNKHILERKRNGIARDCKGKTTFTQTSASETSVHGLQGILRGFFAIYPDKAGALQMLRNTFSAAVNLVADGDDILLEAKPEMNDQDKLLIENLSGMDIGQMTFAMPLKQPVPL